MISGRGDDVVYREKNWTEILISIGRNGGEIGASWT